MEKCFMMVNIEQTLIVRQIYELKRETAGSGLLKIFYHAVSV